MIRIMIQFVVCEIFPTQKAIMSKPKAARQQRRRKTPQTAQRNPLMPLGALMLGGLACMQNAIAQSADTPALKMPPIEVSAEAEKPNHGYLTNKTRVGKSLENPHDIPQAVTSVPQQLMQDQQVGQLREAMRNVSGLTFNAAEGGRTGDNMMLRGFYTFGDMYLDGIRDTAQYYRETFNLEQIDVLRGSAAMLFGRGQAGGVVNQVSKSVFLVDRNKVSASAGTDDYRQFTADLNKKIAENSAIRVNLLQRDEGSWRSNPVTGTEPEVHRKGAAINASFGVGTANEFSLVHSSVYARDNADYGLSFDPPTRAVSTRFAPESFWGIDANFFRSDTHLSTLAYTHRFENRAELRTQLRYAKYGLAYWASAPSATIAPSALGNAPKTRKSDTQNTTLQTDYTQTLNAFGVKHALLAGFEYLDEDNRRSALVNLGTTAAPRYDRSVLATPVTYTGKTYAAYAQDSVQFAPQWRLTLGLRRDQLKANYSSLTSPRLEFGQNSTRAGLSYEPSEDSHYYLSASNAFSPTADLYQLSGGAYPPERSKVIELGSKWLLVHGDLALRLAAYRADKDWERNTDLESTAAILTKKRRTDGFEAEAAGRITANWEVFAGVALMNAKILEVAENRNATTGVLTRADARFTGQRARNAPAYTFNLWTTYKLSEQWKIGGGLEGKGKRYVYSPSAADASALFASGAFNPNTAPAYVRWDAMVSYEKQAWTLRLNLKNITDKLYYEGLYDNGGFAVPGMRRSVVATAEYAF
jgi:catecholate siderophore receptor